MTVRRRMKSAAVNRVIESPLLRFLVVGFANTGLYAVLSLFFMKVLPIPEQAAAAAAYVVCLPISFLTQKQLVFSPGSQISGPQIRRFLLMHGTNIALAYVAVAVAIGPLQRSQETAVIASCALIAGFSYVLMRMWVFAPPRESR